MALYQPMQGSAPSSARAIKDYITLVESEEAQYSASNRDTKLMLTRFRKIYYDTSGWSKFIIKGVDNIAGHYRQIQEPDGAPYTISLGPLGSIDNLRIVKNKYTAVDNNGIIPDIFKQQEIKLADGSYLDIGHVFAGLDAFNHLAAVEAAGFFKVDSNVDNATWVGDLGSVVAETFFRQYLQGGTINDSQRQELINKYASAQDMLGNIDAYVIKQVFNIASTRKVSEILREYYLGEYYTNLNQTASAARKYRFSKFAQGIGLILQSRSPVVFSNEAAWLTKYKSQVGNSAAQYLFINTSNWSANAKIQSTIGITQNPYSSTLLNLFLTTLKQRISAEPGG
jgi:hypothetical protein